MTSTGTVQPGGTAATEERRLGRAFPRARTAAPRRRGGWFAWIMLTIVCFLWLVPSIGLQNAIVTGLGFDPVAWLQQDSAKLNTFLLMIILIWGQTGFAMVLLSAAIKGVPEDTLEAARIDGANERQAFFRVVVPQIWGSIVTVFITVLIGVMKIFDVVYVMTGGNFNTNVIAVRFFNELITNGDAGKAAAIVVMLMIAVIPVMVYQVRNFRAEEATR